MLKRIKSIKWKIIIVLALGSIPVLLLGGLFLVGFSNSKLKHVYQINATSMASLVSNLFSQDEGKVLHYIKFITENSSFTSAFESASVYGDKSILVDRIKKSLENLDVSSIDVVDKNGKYLTQNSKENINGSALWPTVKRALETNLFVTLKEFRGQTPAIAGIAPINLNGELAGALILKIDLDRAYLKKIHEVSGAHIVLSNEGQVLSTSLDSNVNFKFNKYKSKSMNKDKTLEHGFLSVGDKDYFAVYSSIISNQGNDDAMSIVLVDAKPYHIAVNGLTGIIILIIVFVCVAIFVGVMSSTNAITKPIKEAVAMLKDAANGNLTQRLESKTNDELAELATWFNMFLEKLQGIIRQIADGTSTLLNESKNLSIVTTRIADNTDHMSTQSGDASISAEKASSNVKHIAEKASEASSSVMGVAAAIEEICASLNDVSKNCQKESTIADGASKQARTTRELMEKLGEASKKISNVVEMIKSVADQTNLLSLNASIEAARAGKAGKGFAVVAGEVKALATQTAQATATISAQIKEMQAFTLSSEKAISDVTLIIEEINSISHSITIAVEQQNSTISEIAQSINKTSTAATEIADNVTESAHGLSGISQNITIVNNAAMDAAHGVQQIKSSTEGLTSLAASLQGIVLQFKI